MNTKLAESLSRLSNFETHYPEIAAKRREADSIAEAFRAILAADFRVARRALADAQREHYGLKPWSDGCPVVDALGNKIVYEEQGDRYTVNDLSPDGTHVRTWMGGRSATVLVLRYEARGPNESAVNEAIKRFAAKHPGTEISGLEAIGGGDEIRVAFKLEKVLVKW